MNKGRFRLVFSAVRGMLVAVEENARGHSDGAAASRSTPQAAPSRVDTASAHAIWFAARALVFAALCAFGMQPLHVDAQATLPVTPDKRGPHPIIGVAGNGVPVVNIVAPNGAGVSHNKFTQYNVGTAGLVLNNSGRSSPTQVAGYVQGNPFLGNGSARTIVNEVTAANPSRLLGMTEVAGNRANVILANPAGITCNGCGFINAPRATLTTGVPILDGNGALARIDVTQGAITIDGQGLDVRATSQVDLIARAMRINGELWAQRVEAIAGANSVNYADDSATPTQGVGTPPVLAIDVAALGGMYANAVRLIGTERGVGSNLGGTLNSLTGDIQLSSNGDLTIVPGASLLAARNASVRAPTIANAGTIATNGNVALLASNTLANTGTITARADVTGSAATITNSGTVAGGIDTAGLVNDAGNVTLAASGALANQGTIQGGQQAVIQAASADLSGGSIRGGQRVALAVAGDVNHEGATLTAPALDVRAGGTLDNQRGTIASTAPLALTLGALDNRGGALTSQSTLALNTTAIQNAGGQLVAQQDLDLHAATIGNQGGTLGSVAGNATVRADSALDNTSGTISAARTASVSADSLTNAAGQISGDTVALTAGTLDSHNGRIAAVHDLAVTSQRDASNAGGVIGSQQGNATVHTGGALDNAQGVVTGAGATSIDAARVANIGGTITSAGDTSIATAALDNSAGTISATNRTNVNAGALTNANGQIGGDAVSITAQNIDTHRGTIVGTHSVAVSADGALNNAGGVIGSQQGDASIHVGGTFANAQGLATSAGTTSVDAGSVDNASGTIGAAHSVNLKAATLDNNAGQVGSDAVSISLAGALTNRDGSIVGTHATQIEGATDIDNAGGTIGTAQGDLSFAASGTVSNAGGTIASGGNTALTAQRVDNTNGTISAAQQTSVAAQSIANDAGQISGTAVKLDAGGAVSNAGGQIGANGTVAIDAQSIDNIRGRIAAQTANLTARDTLANDRGAVIAGDALQVQAGAISNRTGSMTAAGSASVSTTGALDNGGGTIAATNDTRVTAASVTNAQGVIGAVSGALAVTVSDALFNDGGTLAAGTAASLAASTLTNHGGTISGQSVALDAQHADNSTGAIVATTGGVAIQGGDLANTQGVIQSAGALAIDTRGEALDNRGGLMTGKTGVSIGAGTLDNSAQGAISSAGTLDLHAASVTNDNGTLTAQDALNLTSDGALSNRGGTLGANGDARIEADTIENAYGLAHAGGTLTLQGRQIDNTNTGSGNAGIEGARVTIAADALDNTNGAVRSDQSTVLNVRALNNTQGVVSSTGALDIAASGDITNTQGNLNGGTHANVAAHGMTGDGTVQSQGDVSIALQSDFDNTGSIQADNNASVHTSGNLTNAGRITAGNAASVSAQNVTNTASGVIAGQTSTHVSAAQSVVNDGLINGGATLIDAQDVTNTGRIYGDSITVNAASLANGTNTQGTAGVIASRGDVDLNVGTLTNTNGGYILANNDLRISGAQQVTNDGATIEALGNASIDAAHIDNTNSHFATTTTATHDTTPRYYYSQVGSNVKLPGDNTWFYLNESGHLHALTTGNQDLQHVWQNQTEYWYMVLPSETYPADRYGPPFNYDGDTTPHDNGEDPKLGGGLHSSGSGWFRRTFYPIGLAYQAPLPITDDNGTVTGQTPERIGYGLDNKIWSVFGITPPAPLPPAPVDTCRAGDRACQADFATQQAAYDALKAPYVAQYEALNDAITAFNADFRTRLVREWNVYSVTTTTTTQDSVTASAPGQILAGGNLSINGALNNDKSRIVAGGDFNGSGPQTINADALGVSRIDAQGTQTYTYGVDDDGRKWQSKPFDAPLADEVIHLSILPTSPGETPTPIQTVALAASAAQGSGGALGIVQGHAGAGSAGNIGGVGTIGGVSIGEGAAATVGSIGAGAAVATANLGGEVIRTITPPLRLPNSALYQTHADPGSHYLIVTDPAYANFQTWASSDAQIKALGQDPNTVLKRIGDGFYEQQLVAQQVIALTGQRFVGNYTNNEKEYEALLSNGATVGQAFGLTIGTALTDAQMAALTSDIVWLVKQTVTLADGSTQDVLTPQVYLHARGADVTGDGALIAGKNVSIANGGDVSNSGTIASRGVTIVTGENIANVNGTLAGSTLIAHANTDLTNLAGKITADNAMLTAGRDVNIASQTWNANTFSNTTKGLGAISTINVGNLALGAGRDVTVTASQIEASGNAIVSANRDVNLNTAQVSDSKRVTFDARNQRGTSASADVGSTIQTGGDLAIVAGRDVNATAATASAGGALTVAAGHDVNLKAGQSSDSASEDHYHESHGFLSTTRTTTHDASASTQAIGTTLSGDTVTVAAGHDLTANAATIAGSGDVNLAAGNNLTITTADTSSMEHHYREEKKSGLGTAGVGISWGTSQTKDTSNDAVAGSQGSLIGSTDGSVHMQAGNTLHITGSDVIAAHDVTGVASEVVIDPSATNRHHDETHETKTTGFTLGVKAPAIDAIQNINQQSHAASDSEDSRAAALHAMAAAGGITTAAGELGKAATALQNGTRPDAKIELSWGTSSSKSTYSEDQRNNNGSTITAGGTAAFVATGNGTPGSGNVTIAGSDVNANNVLLRANNAVNLVHSTDTDSTRSTNESHSASVGVSYGTSGFGVSAAMAQAHGDANSDAALQNNTHINGAQNVAILSGGDTNIVGAVVNGGYVVTNIGGSLNIASVQDTSKSHAHQESMSAGASVSQGGGSGSFSQSHGDASGSYAGVNEQSGIHAGADGFDLNVKGNTDLHGAYIASEADASRNNLTTGTLTFGNVANASSYDASSSGIGVGATVGDGGNNYATHGPTSGTNTGGITPALSQHDSGSDHASTASAISGGTITMTDQANQTQDVASLNRDTSGLNGAVARTPDLNTMLNNQADMMAAASAAGEAVARNIGDYADQKMRTAATPEEAAAWAEGGTYRAEMQSAGAALVAGLGGNAGTAAAGAVGAGAASLAAGKLNELSGAIAGASPTGNSQIDEALGNIVANAIATGAGYAGGSAGASSASNVDRFNRQLHPDEYALAKKNAKVVAKQLGISEQAAEGRIVAEILSNSDKQTADATGGKHDYEVRAIIGCQNLNCDGDKTDPQYANHADGSQYIASNQSAYDAGQSQLGKGQTYNDLVTSNIKKDPVGATLAGVGMVGLGVATAGSVPALAGMATGGSIGAAVNTGAQYLFNDGKINLVDTTIAGIAGALTFGTSFIPGLLVNTGGALAGSAVRGDNPNVSMAGAVAGSIAGYKAGGSLESVLSSKLNPLFRPEWVDMGLGMSKYVPPSALPSIGGTTFGAIGSEGTSGAVSAILNASPKAPKK